MSAIDTCDTIVRLWVLLNIDTKFLDFSKGATQTQGDMKLNKLSVIYFGPF